MHLIRARVEELRTKYDMLSNEDLPVDVLSFAEIELGMSPILFPGLSNKFRIDAAIGFDFQSLYLDEEQYLAYDKTPWRTRRFRFSVAHELGHYYLHKALPQTSDYGSIPAYVAWCRRDSGETYGVEQEANEFAGSFLVPARRLGDMVTMTVDAYQSETGSRDMPPPSFREEFCGRMADKFQVNAQVISARLDREGFWNAA